MVVYAVQAVTLPSGTHITQRSERAWEPASFARPTTLALSRRGDVGVVLGRHGSTVSRNVVLHVLPDGRRVEIAQPADDVLARTPQFSAYQLGKHGERTYPLAYVQDVVLSSTGTPFVSVASQFSGGYSGFDEATFAYRNGSWQPLHVGADITHHQNNWIADTDGLGNAALVLDFLAETFLPEPPARSLWNEDRIARYDRGGVRMLGAGIATAIRGEYVVGYDSGFNPQQVPQPRYVSAVEYFGNRRIPIGNGIAWDVDGRGNVVGDDRTTLDVAGHPIVWSGGTRLRLSPTTGSAFAISDNGTIVGDVAAGGFVASLGKHATRAMLLDRFLVDRSWHVAHAYRISDAGTILAFASRHGESPQLVTLNPVHGR